MSEIELLKAAEHEANWLRYYTYAPYKTINHFNDYTFYDKVESIGYTKVVTPLWERCAAMRITSNKNVIESEISELFISNINRNHAANTYTPLEYIIATNHPSKENLIKIIIN